MVSQGIGGHAGYSGTPMWKLQNQGKSQREQALEESLQYASERSAPVHPPNVYVDAVSVGGGGKLLARHVLVKCLRKVASSMKIDLPASGLFENKAPMGLFALFDGQSCTGDPGPQAAEYCARNFHKKLLENLSALPAGATSETFVKAALIKSFEDLDRELLEAIPGIQDGSGAAIAFLVGEYLFTAVLGACDGILCEVADGNPRAIALGRSQGRCHIPEERSRLQKSGAMIVGEGPAARVASPFGTSAVSRSLGDASWKQPNAGFPALSCIPEIQSCRLSWAERHLFVLLTTKPVAEAFETPQEQVEIAMEFLAKPRCATGEIIAKAQEKVPATAHCTAVEVWFLPGGPMGGAETEGGSGPSEAENPKKKAKTGPGVTGADYKSARLRHILIKFQENEKQRPAAGKPSRTRQEAETILRSLTREFRIEMEVARKKVGAPKKPEDLALKSEKFIKLCKQYSECPTAQKGGGMCGDLGWLSREAQRKLSKDFQDAVSVLKPGDWSDITCSTDGLHIIQRIA